MRASFMLVVSLLFFSSMVYAGNADVLKVEVNKMAADLYKFNVTVASTDEGWNRYADKWDVVGPDGAVLGTRTLYHPHVDEQPFTRSLVGVKVPASVKSVTVRAHDSVHGYDGKNVTVAIPR